MRRLTMKVLGVIGALDPYTHKVYMGTVYSHKSKSLALTLPNVKEKDELKSKYFRKFFYLLIQQSYMIYNFKYLLRFFKHIISTRYINFNVEICLIYLISQGLKKYTF